MNEGKTKGHKSESRFNSGLIYFTSLVQDWNISLVLLMTQVDRMGAT